MIKVLFIAHYFPPIGGAGVQRATKFVKYLSSYGIEPLVLTGTGSSTNRWAPTECSLASDIPENTKVFRCAWEMERPRRIELLIEEGDRIIQKFGASIIFVTMTPFADAMVASELARRFNLPWVADLRDPWALDEIQVYRSRWHRMRERRMMHRQLETASSIIMNTPEASKVFKQAFPDLACKVTHSITNGFDADDFREPVEKERGKFLKIVHSGYLHTEQGLRMQSRKWFNWLLGRTAANVDTLTRSHVYLIKALERWLEEDPSIAEEVKICLAGVTTEVDKKVVEDSSAKDMFEFTGFIPHDESVRLICLADLLFLPMHKMPQGRRATIVPGKTYEYLATGSPVIATVPEGDAKDYLTASGNATICRPDDVEGILQGLKSYHLAWRNGTLEKVHTDPSFLRQFERITLAGQLSKVFLSLVDKAVASKGTESTNLHIQQTTA